MHRCVTSLLVAVLLVAAAVAACTAPVLPPAATAAPATSTPTSPSPTPTVPPTPIATPSPTVAPAATSVPPPSRIPSPPVALVATPACLQPTQAAAHIGETACVEGQVSRVTYARSSRGSPTFVDFGASFTALVWIEDRPKFLGIDRWQGQRLRVKGTLESYQGKPEIVLRTQSQAELLAP